ncbi:SO2930 family diheme c-type cytochrome [Undibacterium sp.]|uniref:SO2930 family diheme c-type cytochrome n=1 Tax=Undibacterium sp. TaxID=1914977 RepID=UPI00374D54D4
MFKSLARNIRTNYFTRTPFHLLLAFAVFVSMTACSQKQEAVAFHAEGRPEHLSDWRLLARDGSRLVLNEGVTPYELNTPLFTDYAHKLRTIWMPKGKAARYDADKSFDFPVGTIISKTFYYPRSAGEKTGSNVVSSATDTARDFEGPDLNLDTVRLVETRLLVRREDGWTALPYIWNEDQTDATLQRTGGQIPLQVVSADGAKLPLTYVVPNVNQCAGCHVADIKLRQFEPIGPKARHLNLIHTYDGVQENQLQHLVKIGYLSGLPDIKTVPHNANWQDTTQTLDARARAYLDINCAHCHNAKGAANTTALHLEIGAPADLHLGICKPPVAAGRGTGDRKFDIIPGQPEHSIMPFRLSSSETGVMMPELGRNSVHKEGLQLIKEWIAAMPGQCQAEDQVEAK